MSHVNLPCCAPTTTSLSGAGGGCHSLSLYTGGLLSIYTWPCSRGACHELPYPHFLCCLSAQGPSFCDGQTPLDHTTPPLGARLCLKHCSELLKNTAPAGHFYPFPDQKNCFPKHHPLAAPAKFKTQKEFERRRSTACPLLGHLCLTGILCDASSGQHPAPLPALATTPGRCRGAQHGAAGRTAVSLPALKTSVSGTAPGCLHGRGSKGAQRGLVGR